MMRWISLVLLVFLSSCGCGFLFHGQEKVVKLPMDAQTLAQTQEITCTISKMAVRLDKEEGLYLHSAYANKSMGEFLIWADFKTQRILDLQGARRLSVDLVESILANLNENPSLNTTFSIENLYLSIEFESFFGAYVDPLYVGRVELKDNFLTCFYAHTALDPDSVVFHEHTEPYYTSKVIVTCEREEEKNYKGKYKAYNALVQPPDWESSSFKVIENPSQPSRTTSNLPKTNTVLKEKDLQKVQQKNNPNPTVIQQTFLPYPVDAS